MPDKKKTEDAPTKVTIVPDDGLTEEQRAAEAESQEPDNVANRNKSYEMPVEGVNQNAPEEKE